MYVHIYVYMYIDVYIYIYIYISQKETYKRDQLIVIPELFVIETYKREISKSHINEIYKRDL